MKKNFQMTSHLDIYGMLTCKLFFFLDRMTLVCIFKEAVLEFVHFLYVSRIKSSILINQKSISFFHKWVNIIKLHFKVQWYIFLVHREE